MKVYINPPQKEWDEIIRRPVIDWKNIQSVVEPILQKVKAEGDRAVIELTEKFDKIKLTELAVKETELKKSAARLDEALKQAIRTAVRNISLFHKEQQTPLKKIETMPGVVCWRKQIPIEKVGLYVPGGTAPLFSTLLMLGIPAKIAGCQEIILCSPPDKNGNLHPAILFTADLLEIKKVFKVGGAQAIAAMAYGTETVPKVYKIFGPGNQYVTAAKQLVSMEGAAIDLPAGPSEVAVLADDQADPAFIAVDLLSQAEHGPDSQVILITNSEKVIKQTQDEIEKQLKDLPRKSFVEKSLAESKAVCFDSLDDMMKLVNLYAPEHLILNIANASQLAEMVVNAGSVFIGAFTPESAGDYASGTNHTLPTNAYARNYSGVSLDSFIKQVTFQEITKKGLRQIGPAIEEMAEAEGLQAHRNAVRIRLKKIKDQE
ncbi:MAG: histidinol dehydrogenase [Calditrichaceae bacterium]|nr:histidinol dehydrogenase [Calditrichaceae bacterium]MBN2708872.1 histidinol dehydrogenase [Calditrichaceae bacterium]RQV97602.1 MAG: histidinol dehydrogenase [Calditrichota bacterium]